MPFVLRASGSAWPWSQLERHQWWLSETSQHGVCASSGPLPKRAGDKHRQLASQDIKYMAKDNYGNKLLLKLKLFKTVHSSRILFVTLENPSVGYREVLPYLHMAPSPATSCTFHCVLLPTILGWLPSCPAISVGDTHIRPSTFYVSTAKYKEKSLKEC